MNNPFGWALIGLAFAWMIGVPSSMVIYIPITFALVCVFVQNPM